MRDPRPQRLHGRDFQEKKKLSRSELVVNTSSSRNMEAAWENTNAEALRVLVTSKKVTWEAFQPFLSAAYIGSAHLVSDAAPRISRRSLCSARVCQGEGRNASR